MERTPIRRSTDEDWNLWPTISHLSGYQEHKKTADCLSRLVKLPTDSKATIKMQTATNLHGPAFNTRSKTSYHCQTTMVTEPSNTQPIKETVMPASTTVENTQDITPKPLTADRHEALLKMQEMHPFCKCISKWLSNGKAPNHEADLFTYVMELLYNDIMDANQKLVALIIPKAWKYWVLVEAHDKLGHQGVPHTYCPIKWQYYWKGMNKDIWKYIANCTLCHREKAKALSYPLQMTEKPETFQKNCHRHGNWMQNINLRQETHTYNHCLSNRIARGFPNTR